MGGLKKVFGLNGGALPEQAEAAPMPDEEDLRKKRKKSEAESQARGGRASTIMSEANQAIKPPQNLGG